MSVGPAADLVLVNDAPAQVPAGGQLAADPRADQRRPADRGEQHDRGHAARGRDVRVAAVGVQPPPGRPSRARRRPARPAGAAQILLTVDGAAGLGGQGIAIDARRRFGHPGDRPGDERRRRVVERRPCRRRPCAPAAPRRRRLHRPPRRRPRRRRATSRSRRPPTRASKVDARPSGRVHDPRAQRLAPASPTAWSRSTRRPRRRTSQSVRPDRGSCAGLRCELGDLAPGETASIRVVMTPKRTGAFENSVVVHSDDGDRDAADNRAVAGVRVAAGKTRLRLSKAVDRPRVRAGSTVWFTIAVRNIGSEAAANVRVCDSPTPSTTFVKTAGATFSQGPAVLDDRDARAGQAGDLPREGPRLGHRAHDRPDARDRVGIQRRAAPRAQVGARHRPQGRGPRRCHGLAATCCAVRGARPPASATPARAAGGDLAPTLDALLRGACRRRDGRAHRARRVEPGADAPRDGDAVDARADDAARARRPPRRRRAAAGCASACRCARTTPGGWISEDVVRLRRNPWRVMVSTRRRTVAVHEGRPAGARRARRDRQARDADAARPLRDLRARAPGEPERLRRAVGAASHRALERAGELRRRRRAASRSTAARARACSIRWAAPARMAACGSTTRTSAGSRATCRSARR